MRKGKKVLAGCLAAAMLLSVAAVPFEAQAARRTETVKDDFDNGSLVGAYDSEVWSEFSANNSIKIAELTTPGKVLEFKGKNVNGETTVLMSNDWYWEIHSLSFDLKIPENASWFGLDFVDIDEPWDYVGDFGENGEPMIYGSFKVSPEDDFGLSDTEWTSWGFSSNKLENTWISVKIVTENDKTGKMYIAPKGAGFNEELGQPITLGEGQSFYNSNVVFADYAFCGYQLDNIVIETDMGVYQENFEEDENNLLECITIDSDTSKFSFPIVESGGDRRLEIAQAAAGERLIANTAIKGEDEYLEDTEEVLNVSFSYTGNDTQEEIAYVFGLQYSDSEPFVGTWAYVMSQQSGRLVKYEEDGTETVVKTNNFSAGKKKKLQLSLTKNGNLTVTENGSNVLQCEGVSEYAGYNGFAAKTDISEPIYLDNVELANSIYKVITTKTFTDDFSTNRLGTTGNSDYAVNAASGVIAVQDGELVFDGCLDDTYFGAAYEYETYEMEFQLTSIYGTDDMEERQNATAPDRWIGIDFGKENMNTTTYGTYGMFLIRITAPEGETNWQTADVGIYKKEGTSTLKEEELTIVKSIPASYFKDITYDGVNTQKEDISPDAAVCFKLVAKEDSMELYMKRADAEEYTLHATLNNVDPVGYSAITCTGWTFWTLDNFGMTNTAEIYNEAPEVVIEEAQTVSYEERGIGVTDTGWEEETQLNVNNGSDTTDSMSGVIIIAGIAVAAVVIIVIGVVVVSTKKKAKTKTETKTKPETKKKAKKKTKKTSEKAEKQ